MAATYPNVAEKYKYDSVAGPGDFLDAARAAGWDPGPLPHGVVFNFSPVITRLLEADPGRFEESPALAPSNSRFFMTTSPRARVGISCLSPGAAAMATQAQNLVHLGVRRFLVVGTAGGLVQHLEPGTIVVVTGAVRDDGVSQHFLAPTRYAEPSGELTSRLRDALARMGAPFVDGKSWTTAIPFRMTRPEIEEYTAEGVVATEMEAAALFAVANALGAEAAAAVTLAGITTKDGPVREDWQATSEPLGLLVGAAIEAIEATAD